jgi:hypothetical protein
MRSHSAVERGVDIENAADAADAGQNALLLGKNGGRRALVGINAGVAGRVARGPVFEQRVLKNRGNAPAVKVRARPVIALQGPVSNYLFPVPFNPSS